MCDDIVFFTQPDMITSFVQADTTDAEELRKKRRFKKFTFRGVDLDQLLDMSNEQLIEMYSSRLRRRFNRGLKRKHLGLLKRLRKAKKECPALEKPEVIKLLMAAYGYRSCLESLRYYLHS